MKKILVLFIATLFFACGSTEAEKPERLLGEKEMVNILYDISVLQAIRSFSTATLDSNKVDPRIYIYKKYKIDSLTFAQNQEYYASNLEQYESIQKQVLEKLTKNKEKYAPASGNKITDAKKNRQEKIRKADSLRQAALGRLSQGGTPAPAQ